MRMCHFIFLLTIVLAALVLKIDSKSTVSLKSNSETLKVNNNNKSWLKERSHESKHTNKNQNDILVSEEEALDDEAPKLTVELVLRSIFLFFIFAPIILTSGLAYISTIFRRYVWYQMIALAISAGGAAFIKVCLPHIHCIYSIFIPVLITVHIYTYSGVNGLVRDQICSPKIFVHYWHHYKVVPHVIVLHILNKLY